MKYLVMENHESHSIVMDEAGLFHRVANMGYEVGDTITEPIFMKSPKHKKKFDIKKLSTIAAIFVCFLLASVPFVINNNESDVVVYMSINPEIHLEMNKDGQINKLVADNADGEVLLEGYKYRGKSVTSVLIDLIDRAERLEYLSEGGDIHITVETSDTEKAKRMSIDLSEILKNTYVEKYLIKIRTNHDAFHNLDDVLKEVNNEGTSETEMTESSDENSRYGETDHVNMPTGLDSVDPTDPTPDDPSDVNKVTEKPTDSTKPTTVPTESKPIETVAPAEPTAETTTEPSSESQSSTGGEVDDESEEWPWWPWPVKEN